MAYELSVRKYVPDGDGHRGTTGGPHRRMKH